MRSHRKTSSGFTLIELMIVIGVISVLSALAIPAYRSYIETANMARVAANFEEAVRAASNVFAKDKTLVAIGIPASAPSDAVGWIALLNISGVQAPGGGPAFIDKKDGNDTTGAIGIKWKEEKPAKDGDPAKPARLELRRPAYMSLVKHRARISAYEIDIKID